MTGKEVQLSSWASASLCRQMYKYYDLDCQDVVMVEQGISGNYRVSYETERGFRWDTVRMTVHRDCIEDLYLVGPDGESIEPTTSKEEQGLR